MWFSPNPPVRERENPRNRSGGKTYLLVKHFALCVQPIALLDQRINLLPPLQNTFNRLMQHNFGLIQFLLNLHDAVCLMRVLVFDNIFLERRKIERGRRIGECGARILGQELVDHFGEQLVRDQTGVVRVTDYDSCNALRAAVGMECMRYFFSLSRGREKEEGEKKGAFKESVSIPPSSISCRWPGLVRSATVWLNTDMNWA